VPRRTEYVLLKARSRGSAGKKRGGYVEGGRQKGYSVAVNSCPDRRAVRRLTLENRRLKGKNGKEA